MENSTLDNSISYDYDFKPIAIRYGLIGAGVAIFLMLIQYLSGMMDMMEMIENPPGFGKTIAIYGLSFLGIVIYAVLYFLTIKSYRDQIGGYISFGQAFKVSIFSVLIKAIALFFWCLIFYYLIYSDYQESMMDYMAFAMNQGGSGGDEDVMEMIMSFMEYFVSPIGMSISAAMSTMTGGALLSLLAAAIGQRDKGA